MLTTVKQFGVMLILLALLLAACQLSPAQPTSTQIDPAAVYTAAAQTAVGMMTQLAAVTPTQPTATDTPVPATATLEPTATITLTPPPAVAGADKAEFVTETVPDDTAFQPGETFQKSWRLMNTGTNTWSTAYSLVFVSGAQMGAPASVPLQADVPPGQTIDLSVNMTAPSEPGEYIGHWMLHSPNGKNFGIGPNGDQWFWIKIIVSGVSSTATLTTTVTTGPGTSTPPTAIPGAGNAVTSAEITVVQANVQDSCPYTFNFPAQFTLNKAATVTYGLEADVGFDITLPNPVTANLQAGTHTFTYALEFTTSVNNGWVRLHVTAPNDVLSNKLNFSLTCK